MTISIYKDTYKFSRKIELQKLDIIADWFNKYKKKDSLYYPHTLKDSEFEYIVIDYKVSK